MISPVRVACIQTNAKSDVAKNLVELEPLVEHAKAQGAELIALPENFAYMGKDRENLALAETLPALGESEGAGQIGTWLSALAKLHQVHLVASGMPEKGPDAGHTYNTSVYYDPSGALRAKYRKIHLFDVDLADGTSLKESETVAPGDTPVAVETPWGKLGLAVCYDVRFPELFRHATMQGMRVLVIGAAFAVHTGRDHWLALMKARAIENQIYVIAPAQWGKHANGRTTFGRSVIIDPWGVELAMAPDRVCTITAELDFEAQDKLRGELPVLRHRRIS